jgi:hypothetical protein
MNALRVPLLIRICCSLTTNQENLLLADECPAGATAHTDLLLFRVTFALLPKKAKGKK